MSRRVDGFPDAFGGKRAGVVVKAGPAAYAAGGFEVEARELGLRSIDFASATGSDNGAHSACVRINTPNEDKTGRTSVYVQVFVATTGVEVANGVDLSGRTFRVFGMGL